jgi:GNAT superfamily N-acetyltransferase
LDFAVSSEGDASQWHVYVVAASQRNGLRAAGGRVIDRALGIVYVRYLKPAFRRHGIGTELLATKQQKSAGAVEQWVRVTERNSVSIPFYPTGGSVGVPDRTG